MRTGRISDPLTLHFRSDGHNIDRYEVVEIEKIIKDEDYIDSYKVFGIEKISRDEDYRKTR